MNLRWFNVLRVFNWIFVVNFFNLFFLFLFKIIFYFFFVDGFLIKDILNIIVRIRIRLIIMFVCELNWFNIFKIIFDRLKFVFEKVDFWKLSFFKIGIKKIGRKLIKIFCKNVLIVVLWILLDVFLMIFVVVL